MMANPGPPLSSRRLFSGTSLTLLLCVCVCTTLAQNTILSDGGYLDRDFTVTKADSPFLMRRHLTVGKGVILTIEPGVEMRFLPGVGISVNGTLIAKGTPQERILFTKPPDTGSGNQPPEWPKDIRLVNGSRVTNGLLQMRYKGRWRALCSNFREWNKIDVNRTCQQLGFRGGNFSFHSGVDNDTMYMLYERPQCAGSERNILQCRGASDIKIGAKICERQQAVGLTCEGLRDDVATDYWYGLEFYNSTTRDHTGVGGRINTSASILEYVDIRYAGVTPLRQPTASLRANPRPPFMIHVTVKYSALDGIHINQSLSDVIIQHNVISDNRGHGLLIGSQVGRMVINHTMIHDNMGDGIHASMVDGKFYTIDSFKKFCQRVNLETMQFPEVIIGDPYIGNTCDKRFKTVRDEVLTVSFLEMELEETMASGEILIYDGYDTSKPLLASVQVTNGTLPQSITSTKEVIYMVFNWKKPLRPCPTLIECVKFTIQLSSNDKVRGPYPDLMVNRTLIGNNTGQGLYIENLRGYLYVNHTTISNNQYHSGLRVHGGAGDVLINSTTITENMGNGVNITYAGGHRTINESVISDNENYGVYLRFNRTSFNNQTRFELKQRTEIYRTTFERNMGESTIRIGNFCAYHLLHQVATSNIEARVIVNESRFLNNRGDVVEFESCQSMFGGGSVSKQGSINLTLSWNKFVDNHGLAVRSTPFLNVYGRMANNTFEQHKLGVLLLDNDDDPLKDLYYKNGPVNYQIDHNQFFQNIGWFAINLRLTQRSSYQKLHFMYNNVEGNEVRGVFPDLNPRSRAPAVAVLSSNNVIFQRNRMINPNALAEVATHLLEHTALVNVSINWWGDTNYQRIAHAIFDKNNRYDLALVNYHPALKYDDLYDNRFTIDQKQYDIPFIRGDVIGGRVGAPIRTLDRHKTYRVDRDILVQNWEKLIINEGTVLEFDNGIGMLVHGELDVFGSTTDKAAFTVNLTNIIANNETNVRLVDGANGFEGRLEVNIEGEWGTVCNEGWNIDAAAIACQQLGFVVHPNDWRVERPSQGRYGQPILLSQVQCGQLAANLLDCKADQRDDHSCDHSMDVNVRCKPPTWAGVRFVSSAKRSRMEHATVEKAGLMDYARRIFVPGIQADYNSHTFKHLLVQGCTSSGLAIMSNDPYNENRVEHSEFRDNLDSGIHTRTPYLEVGFCKFSGQGYAGIQFNPHYTKREAWEIRSWINNPTIIRTDVNPPKIQIGNAETVYLITERNDAFQSKTIFLEMEVTGIDYRVSVELLDYNPMVEHENITFHDGRRELIGQVNFYRIEEDLVDFPLFSRSRTLTMEWRITGQVSGRLAMIVRSRLISGVRPYAMLHIKNTTFTGNNYGIVTRHYNQPSNEFYDLFIRHRQDEFRIYGCEFRNNIKEAILAPSITKYHELYLPTWDEFQKSHRMSEIFYNIDDSEFIGNGAGLSGEHNHVEFSNNVWYWTVAGVHMKNNLNGGFMIELPKVNDIYDRLNHTVVFNDSLFEDNNRFEFRVEGFYCNASIYRNTFRRNTARVGIMSILGMEKDLWIEENKFYENTGKYIVEMAMSSHVDYTTYVEGAFQFNDVKNNRGFNQGFVTGPSSDPKSYAVSVRGVQNITVVRNLFGNSMDYEFIAGMKSSTLESFMDLTANWWGSRDQEVIQSSIFDFDDWNRYSIAEYYPYLTEDNFESGVSTGGKIEIGLDINKPLGGRVNSVLTLPRRSTPYIIKSDLTIMPNGALIVDSGAELQFHPNVGILAVGTFVARGSPQNHIRFRPYEAAQPKMRKKRDVGQGSSNYQSKPIKERIRIIGGERPDEGFLEVYNETELRWALVCDKNFNEKTAYVACKDLGKPSFNVIISRTHMYDHYVYGRPDTKFKEFWQETFLCDGSEETLDQCIWRKNYNWQTCRDRDEYVFLRCGKTNLDPKYKTYWGNLRFSTSNFEHSDTGARNNFVLEYVDIYGAGLLHGEKAAAIQATYATPRTNFVTITASASNGYDYVAPRAEFTVSNNHLTNNLGYGVGGIVLNGETRDTLLSSFTPLTESMIPYNVRGFVDMCSSEKEVTLTDRILLYYKYDFKSIDCAKVLRSKVRGKTVAIRFLQLNLLDDPFTRNSIDVYDGEWMEPAQRIAEITSNSTDDERRQKYESTKNPYWDALSVAVHASMAHGVYGFIAEVVTLPLSPLAHPHVDREMKQQIVASFFENNQRGAVHFMNVGEVNPSVLVEGCRMEYNGLKVLNLTSPPVVFASIQNSWKMNIGNNFVGHNRGGIHVQTDTHSGATKLVGNVTNNVLINNTHGEVLAVLGHHYQEVLVANNYIARNSVENRSAIILNGILSNFSGNTVTNNTAGIIVNASAEETLTIIQIFHRNHIYDNFAVSKFRTTVWCGSSKHSFKFNYFYNTLNNYELMTWNRTKRQDPNYNPTIEATHNWWGWKYETAVRARIWDRYDDDNLLMVRYAPFYTSNSSVLEGLCYPGWRLDKKRCYFYMGGVMPIDRARRECRNEKGYLAQAKWKEQYLGHLLESSQNNYNYHVRAWVDREDFIPREPGRCPIIRDRMLEETECWRSLPYICERDPYLVPTDYDWTIVGASLGVVGFILLLILIFAMLWVAKTKTRTKERLERRASIRASVRSNRSTASGGFHSHRQRAPLSKQRVIVDLDTSTDKHTDISGVTLEDTDTDTIDKAKYEAQSRTTGRSTPNSVFDYDSSQSTTHKYGKGPEGSSYYDSDIHERYPPKLENEIANIMARPMLDTVMRNRAYDETSLDRSALGIRVFRASPHMRQNGSLDRSLDSDIEEKPKPLETAM